MKTILNSVFITKHKERIPILFYDVRNNKFNIDIHVQMVDVSVNQTHTIYVKVTNKQTGQELYQGEQHFNMQKEGVAPEGYEDVHRGIVEVAMPFSMEPEEYKSVNTLNIEVTIEGNKQNVQLFLAGEVDG